jgi:hypothetical protein
LWPSRIERAPLSRTTSAIKWKCEIARHIKPLNEDY